MQEVKNNFISKDYPGISVDFSGEVKDLIVPMVMAYGLLFASILTLILLPCLFMISADLKLMRINYKD